MYQMNQFDELMEISTSPLNAEEPDEKFICRHKLHFKLFTEQKNKLNIAIYKALMKIKRKKFLIYYLMQTNQN